MVTKGRGGARSRLFSRNTEQVGQFAIIQPQRASVSSAALRKIAERKTDRNSTVDDAWQSEAFDYADRVGEIAYVYNLKANLTSRCHLVPQVFKDGDWIEDDSDQVKRVMDAFIGPQGGTPELMRRAALQLGIAGETQLLGTPAKEGGKNLGIFWEFVSPDELQTGRGRAATRRRDGATGEKVEEDVYIARCWRSHPRWSGQADSALRHTLGICKELLLLGQVTEAILKSRLSANILFVPEEMSFASEDDEDTDTDPMAENGIDAFTREIIEHMSAPVADRASAASLVPLIMRGPGELGAQVKIVEIARNLDDWAKELRSEALSRLARGLDIPPEVMEGTGDVNHWGSWAVDASLITKHVLPDGELLADFLTYAYHRPMLEEFEAMSDKETALRRLSFDAAPIMARSDEAASARMLHGMSPDVLANSTLLNANGFDESDAPEDEEVNERRMWALLSTNPGALGPVIGPVLMPDLDWTAISQTPTSPQNPATVSGRSGDPGTANGVIPKEGPKREPPMDKASADTGAEEKEPSFAVLVERLATASDAALERAYERAGAKLVSRCQKDPTMRDRVRAVPKAMAASTLTRSETERMGLTNTELLSGAWDQLSLKVREWVRAYLEAGGMDRLAADDRAALTASTLCAKLQVFADQGLQRGLPPAKGGLRIPLKLVESSIVANVTVS